MRIHNALRLAVSLQWGFLLVAIGLSYLLANSLPPELQDWVANDAEDVSPTTIVVGVFVVLTLITYLVASIGLLCRQKWAAWVYLAATLTFFAISPFTGPTVEHALANTVEEIAVFCNGVVLALAFFTKALDREKPGAVPPPPPVPSGLPPAGPPDGGLIPSA